LRCRALLSASLAKILLAMLCLGWLGGCGSMPDALALIHDRETYRRPKVENAEGPLTYDQSAAIIKALEARSHDTDRLQRHLAFEQAIAGSPLTVGNSVTLLKDGPTTYRAMFAAIEGASHSINLETYIFDSDEIGGQFAHALIVKRMQGVQVNVLYDGFGSILTKSAFIDNMRNNGIKVVEFDPVNPFAARGSWAPTHRDHRKLLVIDGKTAFVGGINISGVYSGGRRLSLKKTSAQEIVKSWRDTDVEVHGPAVSEFQESFMENWREQGGERLDFNDYFPALEPAGPEIVRVLWSSPEEFSTIYVTMISAIRNAEKNVFITDAYFAPGDQMLESLEDAARRGVDVRLLLPGKSNEPLIGAAARSHFAELMDAGVKIYLYQGKMLHAKTATIDGVWSTVGSSNLDWWSIARNDEINAVVLSVRFGAQMDAMFANDLAHSDEVDPEDWRHRSIVERAHESVARLLQPML